MERLTKRLKSGAADYAVNMAKLTNPQKSAYRQRCIEALAAYEDTGLKPIQIRNLAAVAYARSSNPIEERLELAAYRALGTVEELSALVKARDEGQVVVLDTPCKPLVWGDDDCDTALCPDCGKDLMGLYDGERIVLQCPACGQYLDDTKIITRAEAEAAIGGGGDG